MAIPFKIQARYPDGMRRFSLHQRRQTIFRTQFMLFGIPELEHDQKVYYKGCSLNLQTAAHAGSHTTGKRTRNSDIGRIRDHVRPQ